MVGQLKELIRFREVISNFVIQDLKVRYRRSILGFFWSLLNPILTMIVTSIVFSAIMRFDLKNFAIFVFSGLVPWGFFAQALEGSTVSILNNEAFIKKVYLPKVIFPLSVVMANMVNFVFAMIALFIIAIFIGAKISLALLFLPVSFLLLFLLTTGISLIFATLTVFFRDLKHLTSVLLSVWFYLTPIIYPLTFIPKKYLLIFKLNPVLYFVNLFRLPIYEAKFPDLSLVLTAAVISVVFLIIGILTFYKNESKFIYRL